MSYIPAIAAALLVCAGLVVAYFAGHDEGYKGGYVDGFADASMPNDEGDELP